MSEVTREELLAEIVTFEANIALNEMSNVPSNYIHRNKSHRREIAIRTLALERLDMEPMPIAKAQDDWRRVLAFHAPSEAWVFVKYDSEMEWFVVDGAGTCISEGEFSHFISSLPKPKGT